MQNQQLVDYIRQQLQGGVAKDVIHKALLDAGWSAPDVDDSMNAAAPAAARPAATAVATAVQSPSINPATAMGGASMEARPASVAAVEKQFFADNAGAASPAEKPHSLARIAIGIMTAVIILLLGALGYTYYSLNGRVSAVSGESSNASNQIATLTEQVKNLTADKESLTKQVSDLSADNTAVASELAFFAMPESGATTADLEGKIKGTLNGATGGYWAVTPHNIKVAVKNSKDAKVEAALKPLVGQAVELTGTHKMGVADITVTAVNGNALSVPAPAPASTSTPPAP